VATCDCRRVIS